MTTSNIVPCTNIFHSLDSMPFTAAFFFAIFFFFISQCAQWSMVDGLCNSDDNSSSSSRHHDDILLFIFFRFSFISFTPCELGVDIDVDIVCCHLPSCILCGICAALRFHQLLPYSHSSFICFALWI